MKNRRSTLTALLLSLSLLLGGCAGKTAAPSAPASETGAAQAENADFDQFTDELFVDMVSSDGLTLHYELADPSRYGISLDPVDLGIVSDHYDAAAAESEQEEYETLLRFDYDSLNEQQQITYDLLREYYETSAGIDGQDYFYFQEPLGITSGQHSLLPVLMAEYAFYDKEDIENYLLLLADFPSYFAQILAFEQAKADAGLFMSDALADRVIESCQTFIRDPEENTLIEVFPEKLADLPDLTEDEIRDYTARNREAVLSFVVPAYENLISGMQSLKGSGQNDLGLCYFDKGKEYYSLLAAQESGTGLDAQALIDLLDTTIEDDMNQITAVIQKDPQVYYDWMKLSSAGTDDPAEMISLLQDAIREDFPAAYTEEYKLKYVPESLEESMNPAFYLQPPVDLPDQNVIYLNKSQIGDDDLYLFTTLAHEGFPGHLYQISYYAAKEVSPLRKVMNYTAYSEGWATYVEHMADKWLGVSDKLAQVLMANDEITICLYARIDLGVHYEGWDVQEIQDYLSDFGFGDADTAREILEIILGDPAGYLPYAVGGLEFSRLASESQAFLGDKFSQKDFHQYILDFGPSSFTVLRRHMAADGLLPAVSQQAAWVR